MIIKIDYKGDLCSINQKYISRRFVLSKRYREAKESLMWCAKLSKQKIEGTPDLKMKLETYYPRKHDVDCFCKFVLDSLQDAEVYQNDSQIVELLVIKRISKDSRAIITIETA